MKTGIFGYMSTFWKLAEQEPFTTSEAALYFFLLDKANSQQWRMPICCSTEIVKVYLATSKQNVIKAREGLRDRKLIDFTPGKGNRSHPQYVLLSTNASQLSEQLSEQLTLYKNKDEDKEKGYNADDNARETDLNFEGMKNRFLADEKWQQDVISLISSQGIKNITAAEIKDLLSEFFLYLKTSGIKKRDENDCRRHFINWASKKLSTKLSKLSRYEHSVRLQKGSASGERGAASTSTYFDAF